MLMRKTMDMGWSNLPGGASRSSPAYHSFGGRLFSPRSCFPKLRSRSEKMRVVIYARVSTKDQSCDLQLRDLRAYCAARGFSVQREYVDVGESGAKDSRPQLNELMTAARKRKIDAVLVW